MADQSLLAIAEADLVLFLVDSREGRMPGDENIASLLRQRGTATLLVANKIDGQNPDFAAAEFYSLGLGEPILIAASSGYGVSSMMSEFVSDVLIDAGVLESLVEEPEEPEEQDEWEEDDDGEGEEEQDEEAEDKGIKIAVVGRPNVGKSTLVNRILGEDRVVVYDEAGTTRDSIYIPFEREGRHYTLIDTAGIRRRGKVKETVEKFSVIKTLDAIKDANVVILLIDAHEGLVDQDLHLLGHVLDAGRAMVLAINKWDGTDQDQKDAIRTALKRRLRFLDFVSIHFISALHGSGVGKLYAAIHQSYASATGKLKTAQLNEILAEAVTRHAPPSVNGRRIKLRYAHAGGHNPPLIVIHGNQTESVPETYRRYLEHQFMDALDLKGTPIRLEFRTSDNPFKNRKNKLTARQVNRKRRLMKHVKKGKKRS